MTNNDIQNRLAENIKKYRKELNLTQDKLSEKATITIDTLRNIETLRQWPSPDKISAIATALNVDVYELFLPVPSSFEIKDQIKQTIIQNAHQAFKEFLESVKQDF